MADNGHAGDLSPSAPPADGSPLRAAGILLIAPDGRVLLLRRIGRDHAGEWALPGGGLEEGESPEDAARREFLEETGAEYEGELRAWTRRIKDGVDFSTFVGRADAFLPTLNEEHDLATWAPRKSALETLPLHPGVRVALERFEMDELGIAQAMSTSDLVSPQRYANILLVAIRITGTGLAYRPSLEEFPWRDTAIYLTPEFLQRCNGLPVILEHPGKGMLNTEEFRSRVVGTVFLPYINGDSVWAIAKIWDMPVAEMLETERMSTSPGVVIRDVDSTEIELIDGQTLLIEGKPKLLDHIALLLAGDPSPNRDGNDASRKGLGVWDKGGPLAGVDSVDAVPVEELSSLDVLVRKAKLYELTQLCERK
jgi:8-oxo-dGTP pyrophosphatase MutT (NUDIX family)